MGVATSPSGARAEDVTARLEWSAPASCPGPERLSRAVAAAMSREAFAPEGELLVRGALRPVDEEPVHWRAELELVSGEGVSIGRRVLDLEAADCEASLGPLALVLSLMLDVSREEVRIRVRAATEEPSPAPLPTPPLPAPASVEDAPRLTAALGGGVAIEQVPGAAATVDLRAGVRWRSWTLELWAAALSEGTASLGDASVHAWAGLAGVSTCGLPLSGEWDIGVCAEVAAGFTSARAAGLSQVRGVVRPQAALGLTLRVRRHLWGPLGVRVELGGRALAVRDRLTIRPADETVVAFEPWPVAPTGGVWLDLEL